jgi:hypothetical protein
VGRTTVISRPSMVPRLCAASTGSSISASPARSRSMSLDAPDATCRYTGSRRRQLPHTVRWPPHPHGQHQDEPGPLRQETSRAMRPIPMSAARRRPVDAPKVEAAQSPRWAPKDHAIDQPFWMLQIWLLASVRVGQRTPRLIYVAKAKKTEPREPLFSWRATPIKGTPAK